MEDYKKKYEGLMKNIEHFRASVNPEWKRTIECYIPELKESEEENIRKSIIGFLKTIASLKDGKTVSNVDFDSVALLEWAAWLEKQGHDGKKWIYEDVYFKEKEQVFQDGVTEVLENPQKYGLEKQGEQKPATTDKVEPKFKVGDWVVPNNGEPRVFRVEERGWPDSIISDSLGNQSVNTFTLDKQYHLWSIQDAKDGDVLCYEDEVFILKNYVLFHKIVYHCCYDGENFIPHSIYSLTKDDFNKIHPATKEQRNLLFQKMKEAGYEWDAEKKIEQKIIEIPFGTDSELVEETITIPNGCYAVIEDNKVILRKGEQKPAWSEEDENGLCDALWAIQQARTLAKDENDMGNLWYAENWLKSLKERMKGE